MTKTTNDEVASPTPVLLPPRAEVPDPREWLALPPPVPTTAAPQRAPVTRAQVEQYAKELGFFFMATQVDAIVLMIRAMRQEGIL